MLLVVTWTSQIPIRIASVPIILGVRAVVIGTWEVQVVRPVHRSVPATCSSVESSNLSAICGGQLEGLLGFRFYALGFRVLGFAFRSRMRPRDSNSSYNWINPVGVFGGGDYRQGHKPCCK